jgi:hypothetical protein
MINQGIPVCNKMCICIFQNRTLTKIYRHPNFRMREYVIGSDMLFLKKLGSDLLLNSLYSSIQSHDQ